LIGSHFTVKSDHQSLQWLWRSEKGRLARWALAMSEFDYTITHRAGKDNPHADALSRWPTSPAEEDWDAFQEYTAMASTDEKNEYVTAITVEEEARNKLTNLRKEVTKSQKTHSTFNKAYLALKRGQEDKAEKLLSTPYLKGPHTYTVVLQENIICRKDEVSKQVTVLIPKDNKRCQHMLLEAVHDKPMSGHLGRQKTYDKLLTMYYWPSVYKDVKEYVKSCELCQVQKSQTPGTHNRILNPSLPESPNARISIDLIGPLPKTIFQCQYVLVMVDYFTKWAEAVPISSKEGEEVADAIYKSWYCVYGIPYELQSDQGPEFCNDILNRINERMTVAHRVTTPYYPNANGQVERFNQTLKKSLSMYAEKHPSTWDSYINGVLWAYRTSLNPVTGFSPFYLMFGREPRLPIDIFHGPTKEIKHDVLQYGIQLTQQLKVAYDIVKQNLDTYAKTMKIGWDKKVIKHNEYQKGDKVLVYHPQMNALSGQQAHSQVWTRKWQGPYEIVSKAHQDNDDVYVLKDLNTRREFTMNVNKLRKYQERQFLKETLVSTDARILGPMRSDESVPVAEGLRDAVDVPASDETVPVRTEPEIEVDVADQSELPQRAQNVENTERARITKQETRRSLLRSLEDSNPTADVNLDELQEYVVEKILNHRNRNNKWEYLVKWLNYDESQNTWEPKDNFNKKSSCIQEYWNTVPVNEMPLNQRPRAFRKRPMSTRTSS
jgi:hypothetical protein